MKDLAELKTALLAAPAVRAEYDALAPEFDRARELIAARAGPTQADMAHRMDTTQSEDARGA